MSKPLVSTQVVAVIRKELALLSGDSAADATELLQTADLLLERAAIDDELSQRRQCASAAGLEALIRTEIGESMSAGDNSHETSEADFNSALPPSLSAAEILELFQTEAPDMAATEVLQVRRISGGFSKETIRAMVIGESGEETDIVIRKVAPGRRADGLRPEYDVVSLVASSGIPTAFPLWFRDDCFGSPAFSTTGVPGGMLGNVWGWTAEPSDDAVADLGQAMGTLHSLDVSRLGSLPMPPLRTRQDHLSAIAERSEVIDSAAGPEGEFIPLFELVLDWLQHHAPQDTQDQVLVHGDFGLHNALFSDGRLSGLLDWERAHLGNPAEDLAYVKPTLDQIGAWQNFLDAYVAAGGPPVITADLDYFTVWQDLWRATSCYRIRNKFLTDPTQLADAVSGLLLTPRFLFRAAQSVVGSTNHVNDPRSLHADRT